MPTGQLPLTFPIQTTQSIVETYQNVIFRDDDGYYASFPNFGYYSSYDLFYICKLVVFLNQLNKTRG